jgi:hypothetical protein
MPKINGKPVDPKAYALRITNAKKIIAKTDPAVKRKIAEMYPKVAKKASSPKAKPSGTPKASVPKKKTLDDFLLKGKRPPRAPGQKKLPSDSDVILKKYKGK